MTKSTKKTSPWAQSDDQTAVNTTDIPSSMSDSPSPAIPQKNTDGTTSSPWGQTDLDAAIPTIPALSLEEQKAEWIREEAQHILAFIASARHATLQHVVDNIIPQFPNEPFGLQLMTNFANHYDAIEAGLMDLVEGGDLDRIMYDILGLTPDTQDRLTFVTEERDQLVELECTKETSRNEVSFKTALLKQVTALTSAYGTSLALDDCYGDVAENVITTMDTALAERIESGLTTSLQIDPPQSTAHWPFVPALHKVITQLNGLTMQSAAAALSLENQMDQLAYDDPKLQAAYLYNDAIEAVTSMLSRNLTIGLQHDLYFLELAAPISRFSTLYGEAALDPETVWELDEHLFLQIKTSIMSESIMDRIIAEGIYDDDPTSLAILQKVSQDLGQMIAEAFPVQEDKKPAFIKAHEEKAEKAILQDDESDDKLSITTKGAKAKPRGTHTP